MMVKNNTITSAQYQWIDRLSDELPDYLKRLALSDQPGRFLPCVEGSTEIGHQISLGYSTFALKLYFMMGIWQTLDPKEQFAWLTFIKSFQNSDYLSKEEGIQNAFIDPPQIKYLKAQIRWYRHLTKRIFFSNQQSYWQKVVTAETKQSIATLAQIGQTADRPYSQFPTAVEDLKDYLLGMDWSMPWGAGGQASALVVFLKHEAPRFLEQQQVQELLAVNLRFFEDLADSATGAYFKGIVPEHGQLINGAMKILTALDWLETPVHYPERLIDTCLSRSPTSEGCHLVDSIYVLYLCLQQTEYRKSEIQTFCAQLLEMIQQHHHPDGGFSYYIERSQTSYYGIPISRGLAESDIHGTCLLTWAIIMILEILDSNQFGWQVIKP